MAQTDLGKWMITNGGNYNSETTYEQLTIVLYNNSMFLTLKTVKGITPVNDNINYSLMAQGAATTLLSAINATDTYGVLGEVGAQVSSQALVDYLADSVMNKLIAKTQIVNDLTTQDSDKVLSALQGYNLKQSVDELNSNLDNRIKRDLVKVNVPQGDNQIIEVERDLETWIPFLITDPQAGTFNAVSNFWKTTNNVGKIAIYSQKGISNRSIYIYYVKK